LGVRFDQSHKSFTFRYYICDKKLLALGWKEEETWEDGLTETIDWYLKNGFATYWENGNVEAALVAHPTLTAHLAK
jgi:dTDP-D-glucose 4,6-dehydratase